MSEVWRDGDYFILQHEKVKKGKYYCTLHYRNGKTSRIFGKAKKLDIAIDRLKSIIKRRES